MKKTNLKILNFQIKFLLIEQMRSPNVIQRRKIINNEEVKKIAISNGYKVLNLSEHHFSDQIKYFYNAKKYLVYMELVSLILFLVNLEQIFLN